MKKQAIEISTNFFLAPFRVYSWRKQISSIVLSVRFVGCMYMWCFIVSFVRRATRRRTREWEGYRIFPWMHRTTGLGLVGVRKTTLVVIYEAEYPSVHDPLNDFMSTTQTIFYRSHVSNIFLPRDSFRPRNMRGTKCLHGSWTCESVNGDNR